MGLQWKKLGLWDYTLFEIGITEIMFEIWITGFQPNTNQGFQIQICPSVFLRYHTIVPVKSLHDVLEWLV